VHGPCLWWTDDFPSKASSVWAIIVANRGFARASDTKDPKDVVFLEYHVVPIHFGVRDKLGEL